MHIVGHQIIEDDERVQIVFDEQIARAEAVHRRIQMEIMDALLDATRILDFKSRNLIPSITSWPDEVVIAPFAIMAWDVEADPIPPFAPQADRPTPVTRRTAHAGHMDYG